MFCHSIYGIWWWWTVKKLDENQTSLCLHLNCESKMISDMGPCIEIPFPVEGLVTNVICHGCMSGLWGLSDVKEGCFGIDRATIFLPLLNPSVAELCTSCRRMDIGLVEGHTWVHFDYDLWCKIKICLYWIRLWAWNRCKVLHMSRQYNCRDMCKIL